MSSSSEMTETDMDSISGSLITELLTALQDVTKISEGDIYKTLKRIAFKIHINQWSPSDCQKVTDILISFLSQMKPDKKLEQRCTGVLNAVGIRSPDIIVKKLLGIQHQPPKSLLLAVKEICNYDGSNQCVDQLWDYILRLLQMNQVEKNLFAIFAVLSSVVSCVQRHLNVKTSAEEKLVLLQKAAIKSCSTFQLLRDHWSLVHEPEVIREMLQLIGNLVALMPVSKIKDHTDWLIARLKHLPIDMTPNIQQCVFQLLDALLVSKTGGFDKDSQVDGIMFLLLKLLNISGRGSDRSLIWKSFSALSTLHCDQVVQSLLRNLQSKDPDTIDLTLTVFTNTLQNVIKTEEMKSELLLSVTALIQQDIEEVRYSVLQFIDMLNQHGYLGQQEGNKLILELIKLTFAGSSVKRSFQRKCSEVLKTMSLPQLITVVCHPKNYEIFVPMSRILFKKALLAQFLGNIPYLNSFYLRPTEFISPQKLLFHLMIITSKPYREKGLGVHSLQLLEALCPIALDPEIHSSSIEFCKKEIPELLYILSDNDKETLKKQMWERRLLKFFRMFLVTINNDEWLEQLLLVIIEKINSSDPFYVKDKTFFYKFFGSTLRTLRGKQQVNTMIFSLLQTSHQEPEERKGIALALSGASRSHLQTVLEQLKAYGAVLTDQNSSPILSVTKKYQQREWGLVCDTIYSSFSSVIKVNRRDIAKYANDILAFSITTYEDSIIVKDTNMKLDYLDALIKMTAALCNQPLARDTQFPSTQELQRLMVTIVKEEPMQALSSSVRPKAINVIVHLRKLKAVSERHEETAAILQTCFESVLCLPSPYKSFQGPSKPPQLQDNVDLYMYTLESLLRLMETLVEERPSEMEQFLEGLGRWINSQKYYEQEWALWLTSQLLNYVARKQSFQTEIKFTKLELLVKMLALCCYNEVDKVCLLSSWALYHLHCILRQQKEMRRKKMGSEKEDQISVTCSAYSFYKNSAYYIGRNSASNIAKAFAEFFSQTQLTNLVLEFLKSTTNNEATMSLSAAQLMNGILKERGRDLLQMEQVVNGIVRHLHSPLEPSTKEELLQAMCWLAGHSTSTVVPILLSQQLPWDRKNLDIWEALGTEQETAVHVLHLFSSMLYERDPKKESREMDLQLVTVSCALLGILTESACRESVQELCPRLLLALLYQIYWTVEKNSPQELVICRNTEDGKIKAFDPVSCALRALRALIVVAGYSKVLVYADLEHCWEILPSPGCFYLGVVALTRAIVRDCPQQVIKEIMDLVVKTLESQDRGQKLLSHSVYAQLIEHRAVAETLGQEALSTVMKYINDPDPVIKEISVIGMSNLALHPKSAETLASMTHILKDLLRSTPRLKIQSMKTYRNIIITTKEESKDIFLTVSKDIRVLLTDETNEVRLSATSILGDILEKINQYKLVSSLKEEIHTFLVPLLLNLQDDDIDMIKLQQLQQKGIFSTLQVCSKTLEKWSKITKWKSLTSKFKNANLSNRLQVIEDTIKCLIHKRKMEMLGTLLSEIFEFLRSPRSFLRIGALRLIGIILKNLPTIHKEDSEVIKTALETANEFVPAIQKVTAATLAEINLIPSPKTGKSCLQRLYDFFVPSRTSRLFKSVDENGCEESSKSKNSTIHDWWKKHRGTVKDSSQL